MTYTIRQLCLTTILLIVYPVFVRNEANNLILPLPQEKNNYCCIDMFDISKLVCDGTIEHGQIHSGSRCVLSVSQDKKQQLYCNQGYLYVSSEVGVIIKIRVKRWGWIRKAVKFVLRPVRRTVGGITGIICFFFCKDKESGRDMRYQRANKPPSISCSQPELATITAKPHQTSVVVTWAYPTTSDPEGDSVSISGGNPASGSSFNQGSHRITYYATDSHGNMAVCDIAFQVSVGYCHESLFVRNGWADCNPSNRISGTVCSFSCYDGYELSSDSVTSKTCEGTSFSSGNVKCIKNKCATPAELCNGIYTCTNDLYEFDSVCFPKCNQGYETELSRYIKCNGDSWEGTNTILDCEDAEPPEFVICPDSVTRYTDRGSDVATNVTWDIPTAIDNSQQGQSCGGTSTVIMDQTDGLDYGSDFQEGFHIIKYQATDGKGLTATCSFYVIIETITCDPLVPVDNYVISRCPTGHSYGSACHFSCFLSYILKGDESVTCELDESGRHGKWAWTKETETFCEKLMCPELPAPANGALACSTALGNQICTMSCNDRFQTPLKPPFAFVCNDEQEWIQGIPPNCTKRRNPNISIKPGELFYFFSGDCNDATVQDGIKNHFITVMDDLANNKNWSNICPSFCNVSNVIVTCGPTTGRRKREGLSLAHFVKRSTNKITLSFSLTMRWLLEGDFWYNDDRITPLSTEIETMNTNGQFDYNGISPVITFTYSSFGCEEGSVPEYHNETCSGCAPGTYLATEECIDCVKGFYAEDEYSSSCTACPPGMSTVETASSSLADCIDSCRPGTYSSTGVEPCSPCAIGEYQSSAGTSSCLKCDKGKFTQTIGSSSEINCTDFDVIMSTNASVKFHPITTSLNDFSLGFRLICIEACDSLISLRMAGFVFDVGNKLDISNSGENVRKTLNAFKPKSWIQVIFVWTQSARKLDLHVDGVEVLSYTFTSAVDGSLSAGNRLEIHSAEHKSAISGLYLTGDITSDVFIKTCSPTISNTVYSMPDFISAAGSGIEMAKSQCDEINECLINPCGYGNMCSNKKGGYECKCLGGYSGKNCDIPPDFCNGHNCSNGASCHSLDSNYTCECASGYKGPFCQTTIVNGGWSSWQEWSECSVSCDGGTKTRDRTCDNPSPDTDGTTCAGSNTETTNCNIEACPECPSYYTIYQYKNNFTCVSSDDYISCSVTCQDGYVFVREYSPLDSYECGHNTSHKWNSKPPPCAEIRAPRKLTTQTSVKYNNVPCERKDELKNAIDTKVQSLQCITNQTCESTVSVNGCNSGSRRRRSTSDLEIIVTLFSSLNADASLDLESFYASKIVTPELAALIHAYADLSLSTYEVINNTDFTTVDINGIVYTTDLSNINFTSTVECSVGSVEHQEMCAACPTGTYWDDGLCILCPIGTYQDEAGQQECTSCPGGYTTLYMASRNQTDCSETAQLSSTTNIPTTSTSASMENIPTTSTSASMENIPTTSTCASMENITITSTSTSVASTDQSSSGTSTTEPNKKPEVDSQESVKKAVLIPVIVSSALVGIIIVTLIAIIKYKQHLRNITRNKREASFASLNMVHPVIANDYGVPPVTDC